MGLPRGPRGLFSPLGTLRKTAYTFTTFKERPQQSRRIGHSFASGTFLPSVPPSSIHPLKVDPSTLPSKPILEVNEETTSRTQPSTPTINYSQEISVCSQTSTPLTLTLDIKVQDLIPSTSKDIIHSANDTTPASVKSYETAVIKSRSPRRYVSENLLQMRSEIQRNCKQVENIQFCYKKLEEYNQCAKILKKRVDDQQTHLENVFAAGVDELGRLRNFRYGQRLTA